MGDSADTARENLKRKRTQRAPKREQRDFPTPKTIFRSRDTPGQDARVAREHARVLGALRKRGRVRIRTSDLADLKPLLDNDIGPGLYELKGSVLQIRKNKQSAGFSGLEGLAGKVSGDVKQIGTGIPGMVADYGTAGFRDTRDAFTGSNVRAALKGDFRDIRAPFGRTARLAARDLLGSVGAAEEAIPTPSFLPEWLTEDRFLVDPMTRRVTVKPITRGGETFALESAEEDTAAAREAWTEDPLISLLSVVPGVAGVTRSFSQGAIRRSIMQANPGISIKVARRVAAKEAKMPGYAATQGYKGGIEPRMLEGQYGNKAARPWSRTPEGRALQRFYDRQSKIIDERNPGRKFSTSQRAHRMSERQDRKQAQQARLEADLLDRSIQKAAGRDKAKREAIIAAYEGPKGVTPRQAVEIRLRDLQETPSLAIEPHRGQIVLQLNNRMEALETALKGDWIDSSRVASVLDEMEGIGAVMDEQYRVLNPGVPESVLLDRKNKLVNRYAERGALPEGVVPEARGYFPHKDIFEQTYDPVGGPTVSAKGNVSGVPQRSKWATKKANKLARYEAGRVKNDPRVLTSTFRGRVKLLFDLKARRELYDVGDDFSQEALESGDMFAVRNPDAPPTKMDSAAKAALDDIDNFKEELSPEFIKGQQEVWLWEPGKTKPEWLLDVPNVRLVPRNLVRTRMADVFPSPPQGLPANVAAVWGTLNSLARFATIYTPYGGLRYVARNTPQNMILLALSNPAAFKNIAESTWRLRKVDPELYNRIKVEAGTVPAAAGLPELAGRRIGAFQKAEKGTTYGARKVASWLGEISDEPWRVAAWLHYAKKADFKTRADWKRLIESDDPALVRFRDDIGQRVRDDMIDFDSLSPVERESVSRYLFIYPFIKGATKWPFIYLRERPVKAAVGSLIAMQHGTEDAGDVWEQGIVPIAGKDRQLGWLDPTAPSRDTIETLVKSAAAARSGEPGDVYNELSSVFAPQFREATRDYGGPNPLARSYVPGFSTVEKISKGGDVGDQALRGLGVEVKKKKTHAEKRKNALVADFEKLGLAPAPGILDAIGLQEKLERATEDDDNWKDKVATAAKLMGQMGLLSPTNVKRTIAMSESQTEYQNELRFGQIEYYFFGEKVLGKAREIINPLLVERGLEPTDS